MAKEEVAPTQDTHVAIDASGTGEFVIVPNPGPARERVVVVDGRRMEHVAEFQGLWAYR